MTWPEVSPFFHSLPRLREKKVASPLSRVAANASSFSLHKDWAAE